MVSFQPTYGHLLFSGIKLLGVRRKVWQNETSTYSPTNSCGSLYDLSNNQSQYRARNYVEYARITIAILLFRTYHPGSAESLAKEPETFSSGDRWTVTHLPSILFVIAPASIPPNAPESTAADMYTANLFDCSFFLYHEEMINRIPGAKPACWEKMEESAICDFDAGRRSVRFYKPSASVITIPRRLQRLS